MLFNPSQRLHRADASSVLQRVHLERTSVVEASEQWSNRSEARQAGISLTEEAITAGGSLAPRSGNQLHFQRSADEPGVGKLNGLDTQLLELVADLLSGIEPFACLR